MITKNLRATSFVKCFKCNTSNIITKLYSGLFDQNSCMKTNLKMKYINTIFSLSKSIYVQQKETLKYLSNITIDTDLNWTLRVRQICMKQFLLMYFYWFSRKWWMNDFKILVNKRYFKQVYRSKWKCMCYGLHRETKI